MSNPTQAPFVNPVVGAAAPQPPTAPQAAPTAPQTAPQAVPQTATNAQPEKPKVSRTKKATRDITKDDFNFVFENYAKFTVNELAEKTGLTPGQINNIRKTWVQMIKDRAGNDPQKQAQANQLIKERLTRPRVVGVRKSATKEAAASAANEILTQFGL